MRTAVLVWMDLFCVSWNGSSLLDRTGTRAELTIIVCVTTGPVYYCAAIYITIAIA